MSNNSNSNASQSIDRVVDAMSYLSKLRVHELRVLAASIKLEGRSTMKRQELENILAAPTVWLRVKSQTLHMISRNKQNKVSQEKTLELLRKENQTRPPSPLPQPLRDIYRPFPDTVLELQPDGTYGFKSHVFSESCFF